jgi:RIO kinase 1
VSVHDHDLDEPTLSSWAAATHGPEPIPDWLVTDSSSIDTELGLLKTGKEADVHLVRRTAPDGRSTPLAAKRYRPAERRMFHRDAAYQEGRRVRSSRKTRAMVRRTEYGRDLLSGQWAAAEFAALSTLWQAGAPVPYPVQLSGTEVMLEFIGEDDGRPAPRLARCRPSPSELADLFEQCRAAMRQLAEIGYAHGDLSPYNILVHRGRLVLIDLPQVVDLVANPQGHEYLRRDCFNVCRWFRARGLSTVEYDYLMDDLLAAAVGHV